MTQSIKKYIVVSSGFKEEFEHRVNLCISRGYIPLGNMQYSFMGGYYQALILNNNGTTQIRETKEEEGEN